MFGLNGATPGRRPRPAGTGWRGPGQYPASTRSTSRRDRRRSRGPVRAAAGWIPLSGGRRSRRWSPVVRARRPRHARRAGLTAQTVAGGKPHLSRWVVRRPDTGEGSRPPTPGGALGSGPRRHCWNVRRPRETSSRSPAAVTASRGSPAVVTPRRPAATPGRRHGRCRAASGVDPRAPRAPRRSARRGPSRCPPPGGGRAPAGAARGRRAR